MCFVCRPVKQRKQKAEGFPNCESSSDIRGQNVLPEGEQASAFGIIRMEMKINIFGLGGKNVTIFG